MKKKTVEENKISTVVTYNTSTTLENIDASSILSIDKPSLSSRYVLCDILNYNRPWSSVPKIIFLDKVF